MTGEYVMTQEKKAKCDAAEFQADVFASWQRWVIDPEFQQEFQKRGSLLGMACDWVKGQDDAARTAWARDPQNPVLEKILSRWRPWGNVYKLQSLVARAKKVRGNAL
jgi:hypothetical protein